MKKLFPVVAVASIVSVVVATGGSVSGITNGEIDTTHDYVGQMTGFDPGGTLRRCSGSLIDEGVFLTAGHCAGLSGVTLLFGDDVAAPDHTFSAAQIVRHPEYSQDFGSKFDLAVILFEQGTVAIPVADLAPASYIDSFSKEQLKSFTFETYGYGLVRNDANGNSDPLMVETARRGATQTYLGDHNQILNLSIHTHKGNGGGCFGDSGGPHLLDNMIVSITSAGDGNCVANDNSQRVDQPEIRAWITGFMD